jgi:transcription elongation factor GreB
MAKTPNYISRVGWERLRDERDHLLDVERPQVVANVAAAAAEGDRSENAEYIYGKKRMREIDKRAEFLTKRMDDATVVEEAATDEKVVFLSWVTVENEDGDQEVLRIVGQDETDAPQKHISWKSPVGRALLGKRVGDEVAVDTPKGEVVYTVEGIHISKPA